MPALSEEEREGGREGVEVSGGEGSGSFAECVNPVKWPGNEESIGRAAAAAGGLNCLGLRLAQSKTDSTMFMTINIQMNIILSCIMLAMMC